MNIASDQIIALGVLAGLVVVGFGLILLAASAVKSLVRAIGGGNSRTTQPARQAGQSSGGPGVVTASDLYAVRANLDAVSRQLEDLERKLRLSAGRFDFNRPNHDLERRA